MDLSPYEILKFGVLKEKKIHREFGELLEIIKDFQEEQPENIKQRYIRPYKNRKNFNLLNRPKNIPFDIMSFMRCYFLADIEGADDMQIEHAVQENMFHFTNDLNLSRLKLSIWDLNYCLFLPESTFAGQNFLKQYIGDHWDILPMVHPIRFPQSLFCDYKNTLGQGSTCMYWSSNRRNYC